MAVTLDHGKLLVVHSELIVGYNNFDRGLVPARPAIVTSPAGTYRNARSRPGREVVPALARV